VGSGQESGNKSREKGEAIIQFWREKKEREWYISVEQGRFGVLLHSGENWREVYNSKEQYSVLINGWENWEPKDKSKKDALSTFWTKNRDEEKEMSSEKNIRQKMIGGQRKMKDTIPI
jgi:hypothetical protein